MADMADTPNDNESRRRAERVTTDAIQPGTMPGTQYEDPAQALAPSAGPEAGATGPGGTGRRDMRDVGDAEMVPDSNYDDVTGIPVDPGRPQDSDPRAGAGGVPQPKGFDHGVNAQVSNTLLDSAKTDSTVHERSR